MADIAKFIEEIKGMTVLELNSLVKAIEEEFGVSAAAPVAVAGAGAAAAAPRNDFYGGAGVGGGLQRDPDRAEKPAGAGVSGQIQAEDQTQDLNFSAKLLPPSLT